MKKILMIKFYDYFIILSPNSLVDFKQIIILEKYICLYNSVLSFHIKKYILEIDLFVEEFLLVSSLKTLNIIKQKKKTTN